MDIHWKSVGVGVAIASIGVFGYFVFLPNPEGGAVSQEVFKILGGATILVAAVAWLTRSLIAHYLSKDIESFKEQLKAANTIELEKLRAELGKRALEHEIVFRRTDEKIADQLVIVYQRIFDLYESVHSYVKIVEREDEPQKDAKLNLVIEANKRFWDYFLHNRPYVPPALYKQIKDVGNKLASIANKMSRQLDREKKRLPANADDEWAAAYEEMNDKATSMFSEMVAEVQRRLGVVDLT